MAGFCSVFALPLLTFLFSSPEAATCLKMVGNHLHLAEHNVFGVNLYGPGFYFGNFKIHLQFLTLPAGDLEIHIGEDGRFYALDLARLFPPESPLLVPKGTRGCSESCLMSPYEEKSEGRSVFYHLLRPELLKKEEISALSSDVFSGWSRADPKR